MKTAFIVCGLLTAALLGVMVYIENNASLGLSSWFGLSMLVVIGDRMC